MDPSEPTTQAQRRFDVAVVFERRPAISPWAEFHWAAAGITVGQHGDSDRPQLLREDNGIGYFLFGGLSVTLHGRKCVREG